MLDKDKFKAENPTLTHFKLFSKGKPPKEQTLRYNAWIKQNKICEDKYNFKTGHKTTHTLTPPRGSNIKYGHTLYDPETGHKTKHVYYPGPHKPNDVTIHEYYRLTGKQTKKTLKNDMSSTYNEEKYGQN